MTAESVYDRSAMVAVLIRHSKMWFERARLIKHKEELEERLGALNASMMDCQVAMRVLGYDVSQDGVWNKVSDEFGEDVRRALSLMPAPPPPLDEPPAAAPVMVPAPDLPPKPEAPKIRNLTIDRLKAAGDAGTKAAVIREFIEKTYNFQIHEKTVGMTLYRLSLDKRARREGHTWFFVPPPAATENPGVSAPGSEVP
jgi:hypothetical protein